MIRNYIKIAWRNIWKSKQVSFVNITGLSVAIAVSLLLCLTVYREFTYDKFHANGKDIYQVYREEYNPDKTEVAANLPYPLTPLLSQEIAGIKNISRYASEGAGARVGDVVGDVGIRCVDSSFLKMFTFEAVKGSPVLGLNDVMITEKIAQQFFKDQDPIGKVLSLRQAEQWNNFTVTAVLKDIPYNSSLRFSVLMRIEQHHDYQRDKDVWTNYSHEVFMQLMPGVSPADIERRGKPFLEKYYAEEIETMKKDGAKPNKAGEYLHLGLLPLNEIHFNKISTLSKANRSLLFLVVFVSAFLLFIACINFINLTMAKAFSRGKEVGMRKVMGAARYQLAGQFIGEAMVMFTFALIIGIGLAFLLLPYYNRLFEAKLSFDILLNIKVIAGILLVFVLLTLLAGGYPSMLLARLQTLQVLKGKISTGRKHYFRNSLIVLQFVFSALLICCTLVTWQQMNYLRNKPLGFNVHEVVSVPIGLLPNRRQIEERMRAELAQQPGILSVTSTDINIGRGRDGSTANSMVTFRHKDREIKSHWLHIGYDYVKTMDLKLLGGREMDRTMGNESRSIVINERMAAMLGEKNPVGYRFRFDEGEPEHVVVGVVKDFHFKSLHEEIEPLTMLLTDDPGYLYIKTSAGDLTASMAIIEKAWKRVAPGTEFKGSFLDENTDRLYERDKATSHLFISGAVLTIIISCMGLFAIALLSIHQRTKEIGVRKVLGASVAGIAALITRDFLKLVALAILIASPIAWWMMDQWLREFAYHINIQWWVMVGAGLLLMLIAAFTVSFQSIRAALMNPVKSLRTE